MNRAAGILAALALTAASVGAQVAPKQFTVTTRVSRRRQHGVLGGEPPLALAFEERRNTLLHVHRHLDFCITKLGQDTTVGIRIDVGGETNRAWGIAFDE